jgi:predicted nuclease of predicted toxin-antitoxin system
MRLIIDESVGGRVLAGLEEDGHELLRIRLISPRPPDDEVLACAERVGGLLITADRDFGEMLFHLGHPPVGVVFIRLGALRADRKRDILQAVVRESGSRLLTAFTVVAPARTRIRDYPPSREA